MTYTEALKEESQERLTALEIEVREFRAQGCIALTYKDMMVRYACGENQARDIIRGIRSVCGGGKLGSRRVLPSEVLYWESLVDMRQVRL